MWTVDPCANVDFERDHRNSIESAASLIVTAVPLEAVGEVVVCSQTDSPTGA